MRPRRLVVEGFTAFRARQEISFENLELFAIAGATGAGKSTLLDAMMYALFGKIPRMGGVGYQEIIAHGAPRLSVTFDFALRSRAFRVVRALKRGGQTTTQLVELDPDTGDERAPLADRVKEVDGRIEALLGLDFAAFIQAVVLPQGEFQSFLKAAAGERRKMLSRLLRLERYEVMRADAAKRASALKHRIEGLERRLADDYAGLNPEHVATMMAYLTVADQRVEALQAQLTSAEKALAEVTALAKVTAELARRTVDRQVLEAACPAVEGKRARLTAARRAAGLREVFAALLPAEREATEAAEAATAARTVLAGALAEAATAAAVHEAAVLAAAEIPALRQRITRLDEVVGLQSALHDARQRVTEATAEVTEAEAKLASVRYDLPRVRTEVEAAREKADAASAALAAVGYLPERAAALAALLEPARAIAELQAEVAERQATLACESGEVTARQTAWTEATNAAVAAQAALTEALAALRAAEVQRERELHAHHALLVRQDLRAGEACPVCAQTVHSPASVPPGALERLADAEAARACAQSAVEGTRVDAETTNNRASTTETLFRGATERRDETRTRVDDVQGRLARDTRLLADAIRARALTPRPANAAAILAEERTLARLRPAWDEAQRRHIAAERACLAANATLAALTRDEAADGAAATAVARRRAQAEAQLEALLARVKEVAGAEVPSVLRDKLETRANQLAKALAAAKENQAGKDAAVAVAVATLAAAEKRDKAAQEAHNGRTADAVSRARAAGFISEAEAQAAVLDDAAMAAIDEEVRIHDSRYAVVAQQLASLKAELGGRCATQTEVTAHETAKAAAAQSLRDTTDARSRLHTELTRAEADLAKASTLRAELAGAALDAEVYGTLARELQTDGFLDFLLEESVCKLVAGASVRLRELSARYTLENRGGDLIVVDHDNADEQRSVDTLSGGETFLVSLALALELSAQIQATAGAVELDSIFIDEGFGTLDAEALEAVADAIESLPHAGRMVGIITHVTELTERMPARLVVERGAESSWVRLVTG